MIALLLAPCKNKTKILCHPQFIRLEYPLLLQIFDIFVPHAKDERDEERWGQGTGNIMSILARLFFVLLADERIELFELFDFIFGADEGGVWGVDDDDVLAAEKGDEVRGVGGDGEVAGTFDEEGFGSVLGGWCALGVPGAARRGEHGAVALRIGVREGAVGVP